MGLKITSSAYMATTVVSAQCNVFQKDICILCFTSTVQDMFRSHLTSSLHPIIYP